MIEIRGILNNRISNKKNLFYMYDLRDLKTINLDEAECLKEGVAYKFIDATTGKKLIGKFISEYDDTNDAILFAEFRKLVALSGEPEIATVYYLATGEIGNSSQSCYIMDFIEGDSLQSYLNSRDHIAFEVLVDFACQLASGLEKAHNFDVFHDDLHNENIIINNLGYIKIIDFSWYQYKEAKPDKDLANFKRIINEFYLKCNENDKPRFEIINNYCQKIKNFRGLKKEIEILDEISFELAMLNKKQQQILSKIFYHAIDNTLQISIIIGPHNIPDRFIPKLHIEEIKARDAARQVQLQLEDTLPDRIRPFLQHFLYLHFHSLQQIGLIGWNFEIINSTGLSLEGPYQLIINITLTSKLLRWKRANELLLFVNEEKKEIEQIIFE